MYCLNLLKANSKVYLGDALCFDFVKHPYVTAYLIFHFYGILTIALARVPVIGVPFFDPLTFFAVLTIYAPLLTVGGIIRFPHVAIPYFLIAYGLLYYYVRKEKRRVDVENVV